MRLAFGFEDNKEALRIRMKHLKSFGGRFPSNINRKENNILINCFVESYAFE